MKWYIVRTVPSYSNITKRPLLCLQKELEILHYPNEDSLLKERSELIVMCRHANKYLLCNEKSRRRHQESLTAPQRLSLISVIWLVSVRFIRNIKSITNMRKTWAFSPDILLMGKFFVNTVSVNFCEMHLKIRRGCMFAENFCTRWLDEETCISHATMKS